MRKFYLESKSSQFEKHDGRHIRKFLQYKPALYKFPLDLEFYVSGNWFNVSFLQTLGVLRIGAACSFRACIAVPLIIQPLAFVLPLFTLLLHIHTGSGDRLDFRIVSAFFCTCRLSCTFQNPGDGRCNTPPMYRFCFKESRPTSVWWCDQRKLQRLLVMFE